MRYLLIISIFWTFALTCTAQKSDTLLLNISKTDSLLQDSAQFKQAPKSLQRLLEEIKVSKVRISNDAELELDGMLFDETKTKSGKDFYDFFYSQWEAPSEAQNYLIYITEMPYRMTTTQIEVKINEIIVYISFLQPRVEIIEQLVEQAVAQTYMYLVNYEELKRQLEGDDQAGSGVF